MTTIPNHIKALIFDCDGTLADTMPAHNQAWQDTLAKYDVSCETSYLDQCAGMPTEHIVEKINAEFGHTLPADAFCQQREMRALELLAQINPIEPVFTIAKEYHDRLPMAVVSGGSRKLVLATLASLNATHLFAPIITADDPIPPKPSAEIFLHTAQLLKTRPQDCLVFEDGDAGITGAIAAGMEIIDVRDWNSQAIVFSNPKMSLNS